MNLRLGHLVEKIVSEFIKLSSNYKVLYENTQVIENKKTIGEIDFIIEEITTKQVIHMELAYKFYLFDPNISSDPINNWIGPNRNDSLKEKIRKIKAENNSLYYITKCTKEIFNTVKIEETKQALCLLTSLFIPYNYKIDFCPSYEKSNSRLLSKSENIHCAS